MLLKIFLVVSGVIAAANVIRADDARIVNGQIAEPGQIPFQALVLTVTKNGTLLVKGFCGGSIISSIWVLTAAHCCVNVIKMQVQLGATYLNEEEPGRIIQIPEKFIIHEQYIVNFTVHDIALIKLSKPIDFSSTINTIALPKSNIGNFEGKVLIASGFGKMYGNISSDALHYAPLKVISNAECKKSYLPWLIYSTNICAKGRTLESTCHGDSGGPLYYNETKPILIGVTSFGRKISCDLGFPVVFTRVSKYLNWISRNTGISV